MDIKVTWMNDEKTIVHQHYPQKWTWDDFYGMRDVVKAMIESRPETVHIISDFREHSHLPRGNIMMHSRNVLNSYPDNWGLLIVVSNYSLIAAMVNLFLRVFPAPFNNKVRLAGSMEQAQEMIADYNMSESDNNSADTDTDTRTNTTD